MSHVHLSGADDGSESLRFLFISVTVWSTKQSTREKITPDKDLWAKRKQTYELSCKRCNCLFGRRSSSCVLHSLLSLRARRLTFNTTIILNLFSLPDNRSQISNLCGGRIKRDEQVCDPLARH